MAEGSDWEGRRKQGLSFHFVFAFVVFVVVVKTIANISPLSQKLPLGHGDQRSISVSACPCLSNIATQVRGRKSDDG